MSSKPNASGAVPNAQLSPLTEAQKSQLLVEAFLAIYQARGCPLTELQQEQFDKELDNLYRCALVARRSAPPQSLASRLRTIAVLRQGAR